MNWRSSHHKSSMRRKNKRPNSLQFKKTCDQDAKIVETSWWCNCSGQGRSKMLLPATLAKLARTIPAHPEACVSCHNYDFSSPNNMSQPRLKRCRYFEGGCKPAAHRASTIRTTLFWSRGRTKDDCSLAACPVWFC